ncbi:hypothetical protein J2S43_003373 [Catenuloplanes nepalensis]|uniref:Ricin B lectin domain-containing protein n=1 Tax=Catenuloplanes nepalensis TaxID=587533 RepID=A0ABT9MTU3_9ACTN|nr:hypothetical protein [Catenuloplanes nepalensis]MDP9794861.1 hypothetical protein [Catenuloplanes nepalensis]
MRIKARNAVVIAGALAAMVLPGTAAHASGMGGDADPVHIKNVGLNDIGPDGGCLTAVYDHDNGGTVIRVRPCGTSWGQTWHVEELSEDWAGRLYFKVRDAKDDCLELIGEDAPENARLGLRPCTDEAGFQVFRGTKADWESPTWRVSGQGGDAWLRAYDEYSAPYTTQTADWPGASAEWQTEPLRG